MTACIAGPMKKWQNIREKLDSYVFQPFISGSIPQRRNESVQKAPAAKRRRVEERVEESDSDSESTQSALTETEPEYPPSEPPNNAPNLEDLTPRANSSLLPHIKDEPNDTLEIESVHNNQTIPDLVIGC